MSKRVLILSGVPGCGKSTWAAKTVTPTPLVVSADHYFIDDETGEYRFNPQDLGRAHAACMNRYLLGLRLSSGPIVVDNTNIHEWERMNYHEAAILAGWDVEFHFWRADTVQMIRLCAARNIHGVPRSVIANMAVEHHTHATGGIVVEHEIEA